MDSAQDSASKKDLSLSLDQIVLLGQHSCYPELSSRIDSEGRWSERNGITLLHIACALDESDLAKACLESGYDVNKRIDSNSSAWPGDCPIHLAYKYKSHETTKILLKHLVETIKASLEEQKLHESVKRPKLEVPDESVVINKKGLTILHLSCTMDDPDIVQQILNFGIDINAPVDYLVKAKSDGGSSPLHLAVKYGSEQVLEVLLKNGANFSSEDSNGLTPVHWAAAVYSKKLGIFFRLCDINVNMKNTAGKTLLDLALENGDGSSNRSFVELLSRGAAENISFSTTIRLVNRLAQKLTVDDFSSLLQFIPNLTGVDDHGRNIIHHLKLYGSSEKMQIFFDLIQSLLEQGCDLDQQDNYGKTPLHHSALYNECYAVYKFEALLKAGADINVKDCNGQTPYETFFLTRGDYGSDAAFLLEDQARKLMITGLDLDPLIRATMSLENDKDFLRDTVELVLMEATEITESFSLRDVFTEAMIMNFPLMPLQLRKAILEYDKPKDYAPTHFRGWVPLYRLQIRKAKKREKLFESAVASLRKLLDPRLPDHVLASIAVYLNNEDSNNVLQAVRND